MKGSETGVAKAFWCAILPFILTAVLCQRSFAVEVLSPEDELKTFVLSEGFQANLFASEELGVLNPMSMRWDAAGRLFVISTLAYPQLRPGEIPNDKIIMLEDTDDDGRADRSTVFADGLNIPTGLEVGGGGVYVGQQTELLLLKDTDGDGQADDREVLLSGFGTGDTHQAINSFVWSPGGELFFDQGDGIESRVETPWGVSSLYQAGVFRLRPKRLQLAPILDDFMGPGNPWGIAFDDWGQVFVVDGAGGISFLSPAMIPVKHVLRLRRIGKPGGYCGVDILGSRHLPDDFQGDFVVGDFHRNRIGRFATVSAGSGFEVQWKSPLVVSSHRNFRPVDVRTGPDGAVYICDWYNSVICHQDDPFRHPDRDFTHGRIWRISHTSRARVPRPRLHRASLDELLSHLASPERWIRYQAKRVLADRDRVEVGKAVTTWWRNNVAAGRNEHLLLELIGTLESVEVVDEGMLKQLLASADPRGRAYAARVVGRWHDRIDHPLELLRRRMHDQTPNVRMEAIVACAHIPDARSVEIASIAADYPLDYDINYALTQAIHHLKAHWMPAFRRGELTFDGKPNRMAEVLQRANSSELTSALRKMAKSQSGHPAFKLASLQTLARVGDEDDLRLVFDHASEVARPSDATALLKELASAFRIRALKPTGDLDSGLLALLTHDAELGEEAPATTTAAISLTGAWQQRNLLPTILTLAKDPQTAASIRSAAIRTLGRFGGDVPNQTLQQLSATGNLRTRSAAIAALCGIDASSAAKYAATLLESESQLRDAELSVLVAAFDARQAATDHLADELAEIYFKPTIAQSLLHSLVAAGRIEGKLVDVLTEAAGVDDNVPEFTERLVDDLVNQLDDGDPHLGEIVFRSRAANCYACHQIGGVGGIVGPDLSAVGTTLPPDRLIQEVLWPQRHVKEGYTVRQILTEDGRIVRGYPRNGRSDRSVYLRALETEQFVQIPKEMIDESDDVGSVMPTNVVAALSDAQRLNLLSFLHRLGTPGEFSVSDANIIRQWRVLIGTNLTPASSAETPSSQWHTAIARVSGVLRLDELDLGTNQALLTNSFETHTERRRLVAEPDATGQIWIDGRPVDADENIELSFAAGEHQLAILIDGSLGDTNELRVEWQRID